MSNKYIITIRYVHPKTEELNTMEIVFHGERKDAFSAAARQMERLMDGPFMTKAFQIKVGPYRVTH